MTLGEVRRLPVQPVLAAMRLLGPKSGDLIEGPTMPNGQACAWRARELLTGGLTFQSQ
jgi:hypothetical protein